METIAPESVTREMIGARLSVLATNGSWNVWRAHICMPRAYWISGGYRMDGPVTTSSPLEENILPGDRMAIEVLVPRLPQHEIPDAMRVVILENGVAEYPVVEIPLE